ncbi:MAG: hypothetical protein GTO22_26615, partial [Gemmatimonadales bacterium]|nr:hypothetical protein [Gemmatimonadales bacterium]
MLRVVSVHGAIARLVAALAAPALIVALFIISGASAAPTVTTDKVEYAPGETVTVTGAGFAGATNYDVPVVRPDSSIVTGDGTSTPGWDTVQTNGQGNFNYSYLLPDDPPLYGEYEVRVYPSPWSGDLAEAPLASTTFLDAIGKSLDQCANGSLALPTDPCVWLGGSLNADNSHYSEGQSVPYRATLTKVPADETHFIRITYDFTKSGVFAFDYLARFDLADSPDPCTDLPSGVEASWGPSACPPTGRTTDTADIPSDPFDPDGTGPLPAVSSIELPQAARQIEIRGGSILDIGTVENCTVGKTVGGTLDGIEVSQPQHSGDPMGTSVACVDVEFKADPSCTGGLCTVMILWGGHLASEVNWGAGKGASSVSGASSHMIYQVDATGGKPDRSIQPAAVLLQGTINIEKQTNPDGATDSFSFTTTGGLVPSTFSLTDDGTQSYTVAPGSYTATETPIPAGWNLTDLACVDPDGGTTTSLGTATATIDVDPGETVTCTFTNSRLRTLTLTAVGPGTVSGGGTFTHGDTASPVATPDIPGHTSVTWSGPDAAECATGSVLMDADKSCT